jgi:hypothetical protein
MRHFPVLLAGLLALLDVHAAQDFNCMQDCYRQGYDRTYCVAMCDTRPGQGGMLEQPGLPKNPAFDQLQQSAPQQRPLPAVADPQCMKNCQKRGYNYMLCQKQCSYSLYGR